ncbi:ABC transporter permease subunit [Sphaerisporangium aureirubrum]|uniref:ABC transporter permease subunit n=1 Tax=Sphaerisporangium aureirubrum TaxID=1544736 RepID=A0ABW1NPP9_9ACTN
MNKRMVIAVAAIGMLATACVTGTAPPPGQQASQAGPVTITFWNTGAEDEAAILQKAADLYTRSHPDVKIKISAISWDDGHAKELAAIRGRRVLFLVQFLRSVPDDLVEAARIDGAGEWRIWWQIVLPLLRPALAAMSIFVMLGEWNNFLWPLIIVETDQMANIPVALARLNSAFTGTQHMGVLMVASLLASLPTVIFFLLFQKHFTRGITMSGLKG